MDTLRRMWATRPPRIPEDQGGKAMVAGVCEGIGARYQVDPVVVRVLFVALSLAFGGGIFLYLLCWITMPRFGLTRSPWNAVITPKEQLTKVERKERETGWWLIFGMVIFFPSMSVAGDARAVLAAFLLFAAGWYFAHQRRPEAPAGLLASHLPEPVEPTPARVWIPIALLVALPLAAAATMRGGHFEARFGPIGSADLKFNDVEAIPDYETLIGGTRIDLSDLEPLTGPKTVEFRNGVGELDVILPNNVPVNVSCKVNIGQAACPQGTQNADKDSAPLTINVTQRVGSVSAYYAE